MPKYSKKDRQANVIYGNFKLRISSTRVVSCGWGKNKMAGCRLQHPAIALSLPCPLFGIDFQQVDVEDQCRVTLD